MKKIIIPLLVAVLLVFGMTTTAFAAKTGDTVEIPITVSGNPGFGCYTVNLSYDTSALKLTGMSDGGCLSQGKGTFLPNTDGNCASFFAMDLNNVTGDGNLFVATFEVLKGAKHGETYGVEASFEPGTLANVKDEDISMNISGDSIIVEHDLKTVTKEATCTEKGTVTTTCSGCDFEEIKYTDAKGHDLETVTKEATCTEKGTVTTTCFRCDFEEIKYTDAKGHDLKTVTKEATCTEKGTVTTTCSRCDFEEIKYTDAKGHDLKTETKEATCTEKGTVTTTCSRCDFEEIKYTDAKGHDFTTVTKAATCTEKGVETSKCKICTHTETREIPAKGHSFGDWKVDQEATCAQEGSRSRVCADCGTTETETIPALNHAYDHVEYDDVDHWYTCACGATTSPEAHDFENSGVCACGYQKPVTEDPKLDNIPKTGDITYAVASVPLTILAVTACAIFVMILAEKRRSTK